MARFSDYRERKLERLRLGQATCELVDMLSDPEMKVAIVPASEGEYSSSLAQADKVIAGENMAGNMLRDEIQRKWILFCVCRDPADLEVKFFDNFADVDELDANEVNYLYDIYLEMVHEISPSMAGMSEEDFDALKKTLPRIAWSELSGTQWYAAQRFLNSIRDALLTVNSSGLPATMKSTSTNDEQDSVANVE